MLAYPKPPRIHLPKGWQDCVKSAVLHTIALAHYAIVYARAWAADALVRGCDSRQKPTSFTKHMPFCVKNFASRTVE